MPLKRLAAIALLAASVFAADYEMTIGNNRIIFEPDLCNYRVVSGDVPGQLGATVGRACALPTKAEWSRITGLDTTAVKPDTTK